MLTIQQIRILVQGLPSLKRILASMLSQRCQRGCASFDKVRCYSLQSMGQHTRVAVAFAAVVVALAVSALCACSAAASAAPTSLACNSAISAASHTGASLEDTNFGSSSVPARPHGSKEPRVSGQHRLTQDPATTCTGHVRAERDVAINGAVNTSACLRFEEVNGKQRLARACVRASGFSSLPHLARSCLYPLCNP